MLDYLEGRRGWTPMIERDDGLVDADFGIEHYFSGKWAAHEREALRLVRGRVLEPSAGAGRVALYLQDRGHDVVARDISPLAVRVMKKRGVRKASVMPFTRVSPKLGTFDTLVMWGNDWGIFGTAKRARWMLKRLKRMTNPGARIIAQTVDIYHEPIPPEHHRYHRLNKQRGRMAGELRLRVLYKTFRTPWFDYMMVSPDEMAQIVTGTGWFLERVIKLADTPVYYGVVERED